MGRTVAMTAWVVLIILLLIGLIHPPIPNGITPNSTVSGWLSAGPFGMGVGVFSIGTFAAGIFVTRRYLEGRKE